MKILTTEQFEKEPVGTVYCLCTMNDYFNNNIGSYSGGIQIKGTKRGGTSWYDLSVLPCRKDEKEICKLNTEIQTEYDSMSDATYNYDDEQLWCVFNKDEIKDMIERLQDALNTLNEVVD